MELFKFIFSDFWIWAGTMFAGAGLLNFISYIANTMFRCWNRFMRHLNIRKAGWPPSHLDADGDWDHLSRARTNTSKT